MIDRCYTILNQWKDKEECILLTAVKGPRQGLKLILYNGKILYASDESYSASLTDAFLNESGNSLLKIEDSIYFQEKLGRKPKMILCGGGHVSIALIRILKMLTYEVWVLEDRQLHADHAKMAGADHVILDSFSQGLMQIPDSRDNYYIVLTRGHEYDKECLQHILIGSYAYVGLMGSRKRTALLKQNLINQGYDEEKVGLIHTPIGLPIGAQTPEEIAISITAELIQSINLVEKSRWIEKDILIHLCDSHIQEKEVLCLIISKKGSAPRIPGTRMIVKESGAIIGSIGGGLAEWKCIEEAKRMLYDHKIGYGSIVNINMTAEEASENGMVCGGSIEVYMERIH